jgi:hypothetical protein
MPTPQMLQNRPRQEIFGHIEGNVRVWERGGFYRTGQQQKFSGI